MISSGHELSLFRADKENMSTSKLHQHACIYVERDREREREREGGGREGGREEGGGREIWREGGRVGETDRLKDRQTEREKTETETERSMCISTHSPPEVFVRQ